MHDRANWKEIDDYLVTIRFDGTAPQLEDALIYVASNSFVGERGHVHNLLVLITNDRHITEKAVDAADILKDSRDYYIAVAYLDDADLSGLRRIASDYTRVRFTSEFRSDTSLQESILVDSNCGLGTG